jgi:cyclophilin family peptidyl-prolyl cis-trans isomerase
MKSIILLFLSLFVYSCPGTTKNNIMDETIVRIETAYGNIDIKLYNETPLHRDNFVKLINQGFYKDLLFHRVINNFMIQGGDPGSRGAGKNVQLGAGGPGYTIPAEMNDNLFHRKGALAAARQGDNTNPDRESSGSQFYIVHGEVFNEQSLNQLEAHNNNQRQQLFQVKIFRDLEKEYLDRGIQPDYNEISLKAKEIVNDRLLNDPVFFEYSDHQKEIYSTSGGTPHLDGAYTVFGETIKGFDVIDSIASQETNNSGRPLSDIKMNIKILDQ